MRARFPGLLIIVLLLFVPLAQSQEDQSVIEPTDDMAVNPNAHISFPPPVYVVRDSIDIRGTVNLPGLLSYFIEFRPLDVGMTDSEDQTEGRWSPGTVPQRAGVIDDILGTWNTLMARDGLYELRLNINTGDGPEYARLSPIRVENNPPSFVEEMMQAEEQAQAEMEEVEAQETEAEAPPEPTTEPEPAAEPDDDSPRVVSLVNSNVRAGDSTFYQIVGYLFEGETAEILGISSRGTGWYFIRLPSGVNGFIHPNIIRPEGDRSNLSLISPPPLPPTPVPIPTAIPTAVPVEAPPPAAPVYSPNLVFGEVRIDPHPATCNETYTVYVTIHNNGAGDAGGFTVEVKDSFQGTGQGQVSTQIGFPPIPAGQSKSAFGRITQSQYYDELHHVNLVLDNQNQVTEANEGDNHAATAPYILRRGNC